MTSTLPPHPKHVGEEPGRALREPLTIAMMLVPGAFSRNKMFAFHTHAAVREARRRAALLRGVVRQLAGGAGEPVGIELRGRPSAEHQLRYRIEALCYERRVELTATELACVRYLLARVGGNALELLGGTSHVSDDADRAILEASLARLAKDLRVTIPPPRR